jgi:hypothetical protein
VLIKTDSACPIISPASNCTTLASQSYSLS